MIYFRDTKGKKCQRCVSVGCKKDQGLKKRGDNTSTKKARGEKKQEKKSRNWNKLEK